MQKEFDGLIGAYLAELNREAEIISEFARLISSATNERRRLRAEFEKVLDRQRPKISNGYPRAPEPVSNDPIDNLLGEVQKTFERLQFAQVGNVPPPVALNARRHYAL